MQNNMPNESLLLSPSSPSSASSASPRIQQREILNDRPSQRQRTILAPIDMNLINRRVMRTTEVTVTELMTDKVDETINMNRKHIDVQILRVITPQANQNATTRYQRTNQQNNNVRFTRFILCRVLSERSDLSHLIYIRIHHDQNARLFHRNLVLRDNGVITIGSFLRILSPHQVDEHMQGIPLINTDSPAVALRLPNHYATVPTNTEIQGSQSLVAVWNNATLSINRTTPIQTTCSGNFCDKQRPHDWTHVNCGCGCWGVTGMGGSNIAFMHTVLARNGIHENLLMRNFSSTKFNQLFLRSPIATNTHIAALEHTEASDDIEDAIDSCINLINLNGRFTVVFWYSRGEINDQSLIGMNLRDEMQVDSGKINYHVIQIIPTNRDFLDETTPLGRQLWELKYDVSKIA